MPGQKNHLCVAGALAAPGAQRGDSAGIKDFPHDRALVVGLCKGETEIHHWGQRQ